MFCSFLPGLKGVFTYVKMDPSVFSGHLVHTPVTEIYSFIHYSLTGLRDIYWVSAMLRALWTHQGTKQTRAGGFGELIAHDSPKSQQANTPTDPVPSMLSILFECIK